MEKMEEDDEFYSLLKLNSYVEMLPLLPQEHSKDYFLLERQFVSKLTDKLQNHHPIDTPEEVAHSEWLLGIIE